MGLTNLITHRIDTGTARPVRPTLQRHPQTHLATIDEEVEKLVKCGVVEPAASPWASNVVVVTKHDGMPRVTIDFRQLNERIYQNKYPLPNMSGCLDAFNGASHFGSSVVLSGAAGR